MENPKKKVLVTPNEVAGEDLDNVRVNYFWEFWAKELVTDLDVRVNVSYFFCFIIFIFQLWGQVLASLEKRKVELKIKIDR